MYVEAVVDNCFLLHSKLKLNIMRNIEINIQETGHWLIEDVYVIAAYFVIQNRAYMSQVSQKISEV